MKYNMKISKKFYLKKKLSHICVVHEALFLSFLFFWFGQPVNRNFRARLVLVIKIIELGL